MKKAIKKAKGFTMVELIVVIAIIGILAAILIPTMLGYVRMSQITSCDHIAASARKVVANTISQLETNNCTVHCDEVKTMYFKVTNPNGAASAVFTKDGDWTFDDSCVKGKKPDGSEFECLDVELALSKAFSEEILETHVGEIGIYILNGVCVQTVYSYDDGTVLSLTDPVEPPDFVGNDCEQGVISGVIVGTNPKVYTEGL